MSADLPFLVKHGGWIAYCVVLVATVFVTTLCLLARRLVHSLSARRQIQALPEDTLGEGPRTLGGVIRGAVATRFHPGSDGEVAEVLEPEAALALEWRGTRIDLDGEVVVLRGTTSRSEWWGAGRVSKPDNKYRHAGARFVRGVGDGDQVVVSGTAELRPISDGNEEARWRLSGAPLEIRAMHPAPNIPALGYRAVVLAIVAAVVSFVAIRAYGLHLVEHAHEARIVEGRWDPVLENSDPIAIAAALPGSRGRALEELEIKLHYFMSPTQAAVEQRALFDEMRHGCAAAARSWIAGGRYERALSRASECGVASVQVDALVHLGRYEEAAVIMASDNTQLDARLVVAIATNRWPLAGRLIEMSSLRPENKQCIADLFRAFGGDEGARTRLGSSMSQDRICLITQAVATGEERTVIGELNRVGPREYPYWDLGRSLAWMHGAPMSEHEAVYGLISTSRQGYESFAAFVARDLGPPSTQAWLVVHHVFRGNFDLARQKIQSLGSSLDSNVIQGLDIGLQVRSGNATIDQSRVVDVDGVYLGARELVAERAGQVGPVDTLMVDCKADVELLLQRASNGDGSSLIDLFSQCRPQDTALPTLMAILPRIKTHRSEVGGVMRYAFQDAPTIRMPFRFVQRVAWQRDVARVLGDTEEVARLQGIIDRHLDAFATREQLAALLIWQGLRP